MTTTIVAATTAGAEPDPVLSAAVELAERLDATLVVVNAFEIPEAVLEAYSRAGYRDADPVALYGDGLQAILEAQVKRLTQRERILCETRAGSAGPVVGEAAAAHGAKLVVVGASRRGRVEGVVLGTTARRVVGYAGIPVLLVRPPLGEVRRVLLATDLSESSAGTHDRGVALARDFAGHEPLELRSLHAVRDIGGLIPVRREEVGEVARERLARFLAERVAGEEIQPCVRHGVPAREVVAEAAAWDADLVVVGSRGGTGVAPALGSVAEAVMRDATCSVLVVPAPASGPSALR